MKPQWKPVSDVTIYIEDYAAYVANPTHEDEHKWDLLWEKLSQSQRDKLTSRAKLIVEGGAVDIGLRCPECWKPLELRGALVRSCQHCPAGAES